MKQGDIVLVPFPFIDQTGSKPRPALVISGKSVNKTNDVILVQITTKAKKDNFSVAIDNQSDLTTPLYYVSEIRCNKLFVAEKKLIIKHISSIKSEVIKRVVEKINLLFEP